MWVSIFSFDCKPSCSSLRAFQHLIENIFSLSTRNLRRILFSWICRHHPKRIKYFNVVDHHVKVNISWRMQNPKQMYYGNFVIEFTKFWHISIWSYYANKEITSMKFPLPRLSLIITTHVIFFTRILMRLLHDWYQSLKQIRCLL